MQIGKLWQSALGSVSYPGPDLSNLNAAHPQLWPCFPGENELPHCSMLG